MPTVYTCFCTDIIHEGHLNIIRESRKYGRVILGVMCDEAMIHFNRFPTVSLEERLENARQIEGIDEIIVQREIMYDKIFEEYKPNYVVHGDNWKTGPEKVIRENVIYNLDKWGGELIEVPYTMNEQVTKLDKIVKEKLAMPEYRRKRLHQLIEKRDIVKALEVHDGLTGLIAEKTIVGHDGQLDQFDAMWISSLCEDRKSVV